MEKKCGEIELVTHLEQKRMEKTPKHVKNVYKQLTNDAKSIFFASDKINKSLLNKAKKSVY